MSPCVFNNRADSSCQGGRMLFDKIIKVRSRGIVVGGEGKISVKVGG